MLGNGRMVKKMEMEKGIPLMEEIMYENGRMALTQIHITREDLMK